MEQRRLRLGDILDDYCPRERRVTNHAVVAMIEEDVKQTRCTTCDAEHAYKGGKVPKRRKKETTGALYKEVLAGMPDSRRRPVLRSRSRSRSPPRSRSTPVVAERSAASRGRRRRPSAASRRRAQIERTRSRQPRATSQLEPAASGDRGRSGAPAADSRAACRASKGRRRSAGCRSSRSASRGRGQLSAATSRMKPSASWRQRSSRKRRCERQPRHTAVRASPAAAPWIRRPRTGRPWRRTAGIPPGAASGRRPEALALGNRIGRAKHVRREPVSRAAPPAPSRSSSRRAPEGSDHD